MIIFKELIAENFMPFKRIQLQLHNQGITAIEGENKTNSSFTSNGAGKSGILEAFNWVNWGETLRELDSVEDVVNEKVGKDCFVSITLTDNEGVNWEIRRYRAHHQFKNKVLLFREGEEWTKDVKSQDKINEILGIDFKSFKSAFIFYNSDGAKPFTISTDMEQKKLLEKLFDLDKYTELLELVKQKLKVLTPKYESLLNSIERNTETLKSVTEEVEILEKNKLCFANDIKAKIDKLTSELSALENNNNEAMIASYTEELEGHWRALEELQSTDDAKELRYALEIRKSNLSIFQKEITFDATSLKDELKTLTVEGNEKVLKITKLNEERKKFVNRQAVLNAGIDSKAIGYPSEIATFITNIEILKKEIKVLCDKKTRLESGLGGECSNCYQEISSDHVQKHIDETIKELELKGEEQLYLATQRDEAEIRFRQEELKDVEVALQELDVELTFQVDKKKKIDEVMMFVSAKIAQADLDILMNIKKEREMKKEIDDLVTEIETKRVSKSLKEDNLKRTADVIFTKRSFIETENAKVQTRIEGLKNQIKETQTVVNPYSSGVEIKSSRAVALHELLEKDTKEEKELENLINHYQFFEKEAFSRGGIQSYLLDSILPVLNKFAKHYANIISGGSLQIEFSNQSTNKQGDMKEKFCVKVKNRDGSKSYKGDSSGEKRRVDIITLFALQKSAMLRSKSRFNIIFLDEVMDTLDTSGIESFIHLLEDELSTFSSIFLISHNPEIGGFLDSTITVRKENDFSYIV